MSRDAVVRHVACRTAFVTAPPAIASPVAADCYVQHNLLRPRNANAGRSLKGHEGHSPLALPSVWSRLIGGKIRRDLTLGNVEVANSTGIPQKSQNSRILGVPLTGLSDLWRQAAQFVAAVIGVAADNHLRVDVFDVLRALQHFLHIKIASLVGVESHLVCFIVRIFQDVKLATLGPARVTVHQPKRWPNSWSVRHMLVLHDHNEANIWAPCLRRVQHDRAALKGLHLLPDTHRGSSL
mmetsp:Transcript_121118/g.287737  ORF Transcript_121118/g.287737 Transcript_121118/m.287737 type:complete len:238 (+) Transcript_121118:245-958(+)